MDRGGAEEIPGEVGVSHSPLVGLHGSKLDAVKFVKIIEVVVCGLKASAMWQFIWVNMDKIIILLLYFKMLTSFSLR